METYKINLEAFEGPMDLLYYLIKKNDINIYDIPIAFITDEYLKYINTLKELNIDFASEFLVMAAELAHIKSKMLLPQTSNEEAEEPDPRQDLVRRLIEYERFKEAALKFDKRHILQRDVFAPNASAFSDVPREETIMLEGNAFQLLDAFNKILEKLPKDSALQKAAINRISISERILQLVELIKFGKTVSLNDLLPKEGLTRNLVVATLLAMLEMIRLKMIKIYQGGQFETIYVTGRMQEALNMEDAIKAIDKEGPKGESNGTSTTQVNN